MAFWIIEDHGFGGSTYKCSECKDSWNDIYRDVSREDRCPNCGAKMNEESVYAEKQEPKKVSMLVIKCKNCARYKWYKDHGFGVCSYIPGEYNPVRTREDYCSKAVLREDYELEK